MLGASQGKAVDSFGGDTGGVGQSQFALLLLAEVVNFHGMLPNEQTAVETRLRSLVRTLVDRLADLRPVHQMTASGFSLAAYDYPGDLVDVALRAQRIVMGDRFALRIALGAGMLEVDAQDGSVRGELMSEVRQVLAAAEAGHVLTTSTYQALLDPEPESSRIFRPVGILPSRGSAEVRIFAVTDGQVGNPEPPRKLLDGADLHTHRDTPTDGYVLFLNGSRCGDMARVEPGDVVGRSPSRSICIHSPSVSRSHCRFESLGGRLAVRDCGSANGTFVNGRQLTCEQVHVLRGDEFIVVGEQHLRYMDVPTGRLAAVRERELRRNARHDPRTGFIRYPHLIETLRLEVERARAAGRPMLLAAFSSPHAERLSASFEGALLLGQFWPVALAPILEAQAPWDLFGATISLQVVYALLPERAGDPLIVERELTRLVDQGNKQRMPLDGADVSPHMGLALLDAANYPDCAPDHALYVVRRRLRGTSPG